MMPEQYENQDIPKFSIRLNVPQLPEKKSARDNKAYDHIREQGKKAFHLEVAKQDLAFFTFLATHAHRMGLDTNYFGKFAKLTATLGKDTPLSNPALVSDDASRAILISIYAPCPSLSMGLMISMLRRVSATLRPAQELPGYHYATCFTKLNSLTIPLSSFNSANAPRERSTPSFQIRPRQKTRLNASTSRRPRGAISIGRTPTKAEKDSSTSYQRGLSTAV